MRLPAAFELGVMCELWKFSLHNMSSSSLLHRSMTSAIVRAAASLLRAAA